ncbi:MAG: hypothetical protein K2V38_05915 [Gemmataceae bacterium]|nr:hypothetical protein [Gemmataceae bacterium]
MTTYEARCACGKVIEVSAADAGASVSCPCGKMVDVPPLHQLRAVAGEDVLSPAVRVQTLLLQKRLPGTRECAVCFRETDELVRVDVVCERARPTAPPQESQADRVGSGCLFLFAFFGGSFPGVLAANRLMSEPNERADPNQGGQDVAFILPLPVCEVCRPQVEDQRALPQAVGTIPEYAALLEQYPRAKLTLLR